MSTFHHFTHDGCINVSSSLSISFPCWGFLNKNFGIQKSENFSKCQKIRILENGVAPFCGSRRISRFLESWTLGGVGDYHDLALLHFLKLVSYFVSYPDVFFLIILLMMSISYRVRLLFLSSVMSTFCVFYSWLVNFWCTVNVTSVSWNQISMTRIREYFFFNFEFFLSVEKLGFWKME